MNLRRLEIDFQTGTLTVDADVNEEFGREFEFDLTTLRDIHPLAEELATPSPGRQHRTGRRPGDAGTVRGREQLLRALPEVGNDQVRHLLGQFGPASGRNGIVMAW